MPEEKTLGQIAFEAVIGEWLLPDRPWAAVGPMARANYEGSASAVRNAVLEEAAKVADAYAIDAWGMTEPEAAAQKIAEIIRDKKSSA